MTVPPAPIMIVTVMIVTIIDGRSETNARQEKHREHQLQVKSHVTP
jgi:hypothetical protein